MKTEKSRPTLRIILDANALFVPFEFRIDIFQALRTLLDRNFELVILKPVEEELKRLATEGSAQMRKKALCALELAQQCRVLSVEAHSVTTDDAILRFAEKCHYPVFTNDGELRKKLRDINVPVIYVRQKSRLEIDGRL